MQNKMKISYYLSKKRKNAQGLIPIWYKITVNGDVVDKSTGIFIKESDWDATKKKVLDTNDFASAHNARLSMLNSNMHVAAINADHNNKVLSKSSFLKAVSQPIKTPTVIEVLATINQLYQKNTKLSPNTLRCINARYMLLIRFFKCRKLNTLLVTEIKLSLGELFKSWMAQNGYSSSHTTKCLQLLKASEQWAINNDFCDYSKLQSITVKHKMVRERVFLMPEEFEHLKKVLLPTRLERVRSRFIIQCLTGLDYTDMCDLNRGFLKWKNDIAYLQDKRNKSKSTAIIPLVKEVHDILEYYNWNLPEISLQKYNAYLKELGEAAGIKSALTSKSGRYTFGMLMLSYGFSIEVVSRMMGHSSIRITERVYAKIMPDRIMNEAVFLGMNLTRATG
jgi:integrase/recombinase XerD